MEKELGRGRSHVDILVVDDEVTVADMLYEWLAGGGYTVIKAYGGAEGIREVFDKKPDLAIVDIIMPQIDGLELVRRIREVSDIPIIVLSAKGQEEVKVEALNRGADEYVVKPVGKRELQARVAAALRRARPQGPVDDARGIYSDGVLTIDFSRYELSVRGERQNLTKLEFRLLAYLVRNAGQVLTYDELLDQVWGPNYETPDYITWHIKQLRHKVERDPTNPELILNVRGIGYMYDKPSDQSLTSSPPGSAASPKGSKRRLRILTGVLS